jgi:hypothetical protein
VVVRLTGPGRHLTMPRIVCDRWFYAMTLQPHRRDREGRFFMPLFEVETDSHIIITWAEDEQAATGVVRQSYPNEPPLRITRRPRDTWVISKSALGISGPTDPCSAARDCLSKAAGDKVHAIRLYMQQTGADLERSRKAIESNMVMGW